jgi:hypothetical protein
VLARAGLGDDALRAEPLREQRLAERVVDLVRAGVREVLALEPHLAPQAATGAARRSARVGRPDPASQLRSSSAWNDRSGRMSRMPCLEPLERGHQRFGHDRRAGRTDRARRGRAT